MYNIKTMATTKGTILVSVQKAAITGAVAAFGINVLTDSTSTIFVNKSKMIFGERVDVWKLALAVGFTGSLIVELVSKYVLKHIPHNQKSVHMESITLHMVSSSVVFYAIPKIMNDQLTFSEASKFMGCGILAEAVSTFASDYLLSIEQSAGFNTSAYYSNR